MLHRDHHDHGGQRNAGYRGDEWKQQRKCCEYRRAMHQHRKRRPAAEGAIDDAGANIDAAGDAAKGRGENVADAEPCQQAVTVGLRIAGL
jgi:hypothetical protein